MQLGKANIDDIVLCATTHNLPNYFYRLYLAKVTDKSEQYENSQLEIFDPQETWWVQYSTNCVVVEDPHLIQKLHTLIPMSGINTDIGSIKRFSGEDLNRLISRLKTQETNSK